MEKLKEYRRTVGVNLHGKNRETADQKLWECAQLGEINRCRSGVKKPPRGWLGVDASGALSLPMGGLNQIDKSRHRI